jgi:ABC-2 type transport system ATP-binding protein
MTSLLEARSLSLVRDGTVVLNDVSFAVAPGDVYALLGGNGAGKSTTLLTFLGFLAPSGGEVLVDGKSVAGNVEAARAQIA